MKMTRIRLTINGKVAEAAAGEMLLDVINRQAIDIPTLCNHKSVEPSGACRLCMVEISRPEWSGRSKHVTSCLYPVEPDLIVNTHTDQVNRMRRTIIDLYLARHPDSDEIKNLAEEYGLTATSFETVPDGDNCILCGLCTRICDRMGFHAISLVGRGHGKTVAPPLNEPPPDCTGCLSCAINCPTGHITFRKDDTTLSIWGRQFELLACKNCGATTITREFATHLSLERDIPAEYFEVCSSCHARETAKNFGRIVSLTGGNGN